MSGADSKQHGELFSGSQSVKNADKEKMIKEYTYLVKSIASKYESSPMETDDIVQEGMIGLLAAINSYDKSRGTGFKTYAGVCIDNSIQTSMRKFYRQKDIPVQNMVEYHEENIPESYVNISAEDTFIAQESVSLLTKALKENLSDFENEVLRLYIVGCSYGEIAQRLNKTSKAVDNAIQRIRKKLAALNL